VVRRPGFTVIVVLKSVCFAAYGSFVPPLSSRRARKCQLPSDSRTCYGLWQVAPKLTVTEIKPPFAALIIAQAGHSVEEYVGRPSAGRVHSWCHNGAASFCALCTWRSSRIGTVTAERNPPELPLDVVVEQLDTGRARCRYDCCACAKQDIRRPPDVR
jgi:hypothetical protein